MGIVTGYACLICALLLVLKFVARKQRLKKVNHFLMKIHKFTGFLLLFIGIVHLVAVIPVLSVRLPIITVSGITVLLLAMILVILCHTMKNRKKELFLHRLISVAIVCTTIIHMVFYGVGFSRYQHQIEQIAIQNTEVENISDGIYIGEADVGYIYAKVKITVKNGKIVAAELLSHHHERGKNAEKILDEMVLKQSIDVDIISGATNSSLVIKKACENAFLGE